MKQFIKLTTILLTIMLMFSSCANNPTIDKSDPSSAYTVSITSTHPISSTTSSSPAKMGVSDGKEGATALPLVPKWSYQKSSDNLPTFLSKDLQMLFSAAERMFYGFRGCTPGYFKDYETSIKVPTDKGELTYCLDNGFKTYDDFNTALHAVYTDEYISELFNDSTISSMIEYEGKLYSLDADRGSNIEYVSASYELIGKSDEEIAFNMTGHYNPTSLGDVKLDPAQEYTQEHKTHLKLTETGWRFDNFVTLF